MTRRLWGSAIIALIVGAAVGWLITDVILGPSKPAPVTHGAPFPGA
jgi:uncharacterized membrane-anchored protein YhcB (DUF1043 family)